MIFVVFLGRIFAAAVDSDLRSVGEGRLLLKLILAPLLGINEQDEPFFLGHLEISKYDSFSKEFRITLAGWRNRWLLEYLLCEVCF